MRQVRVLFIILCFFPLFANAGYQRNVARQVDKVTFGKVDSVRYFNQQEMEHAKDNGLSMFLGAIAGGVIGNQFGRGPGRPIATIIGSVAGAAVGHQFESRPYHRADRLVELLIKGEDGQLVDVVQDVDPNMLFNKGDRVRVLYFPDGVRVDREM